MSRVAPAEVRGEPPPPASHLFKEVTRSYVFNVKVTRRLSRLAQTDLLGAGSGVGSSPPVSTFPSPAISGLVLWRADRMG